jgi:hypothetical protein
MTKSTKNCLITIAIIVAAIVGFIWYVHASGFPIGPTIGLTLWVILGFATMGSSRKREKAQTQLEQAVTLFAFVAWFNAMAIWAEGESFFAAIGMGVVGTIGIGIMFWCGWYLVEGRHHE